MSLSLYELVKTIDQIVGEDPKGKPEHTIAIFTRVLYDTRHLNKNGKPVKQEHKTPKNKVKPVQTPRTKRKLKPEEFNTLVAQIIAQDKKERELPTYEQCLNHMEAHTGKDLVTN